MEKKLFLKFFAFCLPTCILFAVVTIEHFDRKRSEEDARVREYAIGLRVSGSYESAFDLFRYLAARGDSASCYYLGRMYLEGFHVEKKLAPALDYLTRAAEGGYVLAQYDLAILYDKEPIRDQARRIYWLQKAAKLDYPPALINLSVLYFAGDGVKKNPEYAFRLLEKAADQGDPIAQARLAWLYIQGRERRGDVEKGLSLLQKAAADDASAQYVLGIIYYLRNENTQSRKYLWKAIQQKLPSALLFTAVVAEERGETKLAGTCRKKLSEMEDLPMDKLALQEKHMRELCNAKKALAGNGEDWLQLLPIVDRDEMGPLVSSKKIVIRPIPDSDQFIF